MKYFWKNFKIIDDIQNINIYSNDVTLKCLNRVPETICPGLNTDDDTRDSVVDMNEILKLAKQTCLDEVNIHEGILQETTESLMMTRGISGSRRTQESGVSWMTCPLIFKFL